MAETGLRVNEASHLDLADVKWDLGRFGKLHVRKGKGARGSGPRERMVPLINGAGATLRWFIEDVWGCFDDDHARPGAPLFAPSAATPTAAPPGWVMRRCAPRWPRRRRCTCRTGRSRVTPHVLRHFCASQLYLGGMDLVAIQQALGHAWVATTMNYVHVHATHVEDAWITGQAGRRPPEGTRAVKWNLRLAAANRGIWKASELQRMLAGAGLVISAGKMSGLWSGTPASVKLDDLEIICAVLGCGVEELLIAEPGMLAQPAGDQPGQQAASSPAMRRLRPGAATGARSRPREVRPPAGRAPATSCPDCLSFGSSYGTQSYCRACYDFTRRYHPGECAGCARILAVKKGHCRLCWLQASLIATGRRITPADLARAGRYQQLSFAGNEPGSATRPAAPGPGNRTPPAARPGCRDTTAATGSRPVPALRQGPLGRIGHHRPGPAAGQGYRRRTRRHPRLEPPDRHRDRPGAGCRPG